MPYNPELQMLREVVWQLLGMGDGDTEGPDAPRCTLCGQHLLRAEGINRTFGHRHHTAIKRKLTFHHRDKHRDNNHPSNRELVHQTCHKQYHNEKRGESSENPVG